MRKQVLHPRTAVINQKQKNQSKKARLDALQWLTHTFPLAFDNRVSIRPLSLGIMSEILKQADKAQESGISKSKLREAVVLYTRRLDYLACLKARESRVDLYGQITEPVTEEDAESAATKIRKRVEKSIKNAKKSISNPLEKHKIVKSRHQTNSSNASRQDYFSHHPEPLPAFSLQHGMIEPTKASMVTIKHKSARQYDPEAVARLKEKLGLSRKPVEKEETP